MPYINQSDRSKFESHIMDVLGIIKNSNDSVYVKGEYFGYFVNRLMKEFAGDPDYTQNSFNSGHFADDKKKTLSRAADMIVVLLPANDPLGAAGNLNYCISAVYWGVLGDAKDFSNAGYGFRAYLDAMLDKVKDSIQSLNSGANRDVTMAFRRHLIARQVLNHILSETYRLKHVPYEEKKIAENGTVWVDGELLLPEDKNV